MECIVLAGGLGTRLRDEIQDLPKCMAPVNEKPFLEYVLNYLENQFVDHVILSLGYKHESVIDWLKNKAFTFRLSTVIEQEPLGTGGAIRRALQKSKSKQVYVLNGDTYFDVDLRSLKTVMTEETKAVLALKEMKDFDRYGAVQLDEEGYILNFEEKGFKESGLINGGIYLLNKSKEDLRDFPEKFSFEKEFLEKKTTSRTLKGIISTGYFIDIGIPEDYKKAQDTL